RRAVFTDVMDVIERKIAAGEYMLSDLPGERRLAEEVGVSYMTARKAVLRLIDKEVLSRKPNGSLTVHPRLHGDVKQHRIALLSPAYPAAHLVRLRLEVTRWAMKDGLQFRAFEYIHWDDAIVRQAVDGCDGLVVIPSTEAIPERLLGSFSAAGSKVLCLDGDMTDHGIPSIRLFSREHIRALFDHLRSLGHRRISCLNTQGRNAEIEARIGQWRAWLTENDATGALWDDPAPPFEDPMARARDAMHGILAAADGPLGAIVCTTQPAAVGAMRACYDRGVVVGRDVSICTINNEPTGEFFCPSLTGLEMPDIEPLLERCYGWFTAENDNPFTGELLITPAQPALLRGESTGNAPDAVSLTANDHQAV
ncbi:MAG: substrate-binding domain-containing protein, partial [Planctomycetota bacterium]